MNSNSITSLHYGQQAISHFDLNAGDGLKSLWIEIPEYCHLYCSYCFASTNSNQNRNCTTRKSEEYLVWDDYKKLLTDFADAGGKFLGIPGRGEPFHPKNLDLVKKIINLADDLKLKTTIFTTGETIFFTPEYISEDGEKKILRTDIEAKYDIMNFLKTKDVVLLIKWNSDDHAVQDRLVNTDNYAELRERALNLLLDNGFNQANTPKLGIVTSILKDNKTEIVDLYRKYHKQKGLIFDCDTILPRGRGNKYLTDNKANLTHEELKNIFAELKKEGAILTCQGGTYVGVACDRILHHLYVSITGDVYPCIGCFETGSKKDFKLGNIKIGGKHENILKFWNDPIRTKLRTDIDEVFDGVCKKCRNFKDKTCYSCLGRCVDKVERDDEKGNILITTHGCINHIPDYFEWIIKSEEYFRDLLSYSETKRLFKEDFENLWMPNRNITFRINQQPEKERKELLKKLAKSENPHSASCPYVEKTWIDEFSSKKHYNYSDLKFPMNSVYEFISDPLRAYKECTEFKESDKRKLITILSKSLLSNIFLPFMKVLFDKADEDSSILLCNFMLFNNKAQKYFYRTISKNENENSENFKKTFILFRWAESFGDDNFYSSESKGRIFDLSRYFRNIKNNSMYELVLDKSGKTKEQRYYLEDVLECGLVEETAQSIINELNSICGDRNIDDIIQECNKKIFSSHRKDNNVKQIECFYEQLNKKLIQETATFKDGDLDSLNEKVELLQNDSINKVYEQKKVEVINYFIFLRVLRDVLGIKHYYLIHSNSYNFLEKEGENFLSTFGVQPSGILVCSKNPVKTDLINKIRLFTATIFSPIDSFYYMEAKKEVLKQATRAAISQVFVRNIAHNIVSHVLIHLTNEKSFSPEGIYKLINKSNAYISNIVIPQYNAKKDKVNNKKLEIGIEYLKSTIEETGADFRNAFEQVLPLFNYKINNEEKNLYSTQQVANLFSYVANRCLYLNEATYGVSNMVGIKRVYGELFKELDANRILLNHIPAIDNFSYKINVRHNGKILTDNDDISVSLPADVLGAQAFYNIIENIIRNTAKHNNSKSDVENGVFIFTVNFIDEPLDKNDPFSDEDKYYRVEIWDNVPITSDKAKLDEEIENIKKEEKYRQYFYETKKEEKEPIKDAADLLVFKQNTRMNNSIIDPVNHTLRTGSLGLIEMEASTAFLRQIDLPEIEDDYYTLKHGEYYNKYDGKDYPYFIQAFKKDLGKDKSGVQIGYSLGYRFYMKKPEKYLIISDNTFNKDDKKQLLNNGITIISREDFLTSLNEPNPTCYNHEFALLVKSKENNDSESPFKFFFESREAKKIDKVKDRTPELSLLPERLMRVDNEFIACLLEKKTDKNVLDDFEKKVWEQWMKPRDKDWNTNNFSIDSSISYGCENKCSLVLFDHFSKTDQVDFEKLLQTKSKYPYCEPLSSSGQQKLPFFSQQKDKYDPLTNYVNEVNLYVHQLLWEAYDNRVLVIDERVQKFSLDNYEGYPLMPIFKRMNVIIPDPEKDNVNLEANIYDDDLVKKIEKFIDDEIEASDFMLVHYGVLERMGQKHINENLKKWAKQTRVVVTTGRGKHSMSELPKEVSYINIGAVLNAFRDNRSKYLINYIINQSRR
ncbi:MAG TPA: SPASM domain-containing protein [Bacteroidales bacterium]|jgi:hypothetical protein|nr:SPASM domain-containing protein [Bacteroidales bacterium]HPY21878.1 SPASM domain-containing protein [Bacteroidales bacterium]